MAMVHLPESPTRQQEESNDTEETPNVSEPSEAVAATSEKPEEEDEEVKLSELPKEEEVGVVVGIGTTSDQNEISSAEASVSTSTTGTRSGTSSSISSNSSSRPSSRGSEKNESISLPQHQYDKEELIKLSKTDLAKKWPDFLDPTFLNSTSGVWDPEKWFKNKRGTDTPTDDARAKRERPAEFERDLSFKRRTPDPKERIKEERDDIVLSPQRRSFGTGCHVSQQTFPVTTSNNRRPGSPNDSREPESLHRDTRRIGSGRIVSRDTRDKDREYGYGGGRNNRFDRDDREKEPPTRFMGRYRANDRRMSRGRDDRIDEEDEPEWFSAGPTSQHETIELVGFDNPCNHEKSVAGRGRRGKELTRKNLMPTRLSEANVRSQNREPEPLVPTKDVIERGGDKSGEKVVVVTERVSSSPSPRPNEMDQQQQNDSDKKQDFDLNDIFKMDWIPGLLPNGSPPEAADSGFTGSRFSQWFSRDSPVKDLLDSEENSRRSSIQDEIRAQMMGLKRGPSPPSQHHSSSNNYFIPINPPGMHHGGGQRYNHEHHGGGAGSKDGKNILEILQNANINVTPLLNSENHTHSLKDETMSGKAKSVVELEADLKQLVLGGNRASEEKSAFNKLLSQLSDQGATMSAPPQSISMGHVDKSKIIQEEDLITQNFNLRMMQQQQQHHQHHQNQHHNQLIQHVAAQHRQPTPPTHVQQHQPNNVVPAKQPPQQPIIQMPDLRISPTPTLAPPQMYGVDKDMLIDFFKDLDKPSVSSTTSSVNVNVTLGQGQGHQNVMRPKEQQEQQQQQQQQPNNVADMMRVLYEQGNQNEMMVRLMAQQQHLHNMQNAAQQQQQQQQQNSRIFQTASPGTVERTMQQAMNQAFQNKQQQQQQAKPHDLMATQQQRPKFMSTLVPAPYGGHILNPSPTPDPSMGQTLGVPIAVGPHLSPRQSPLSHDLGTAVPARIPSPLVFGQAPPLLSHAPAPIHPSQISQSNTLQVQNQNALPRVPSPQELAAHTQTILQNALIKRKLEEQKENYRKRQEAQRSRSPNVVATTPGGTALPKSPSSNTAPITSSSSPSKFTSTMAAFTPTSVMRKMHSEKLDKENRGDAVSPQQQGKGHDVSSPEHKIQTTPTSANNSQSSIPQQNGIIQHQHQQQHLQNNHGGGMNHHNHVIENHQQHQIEHHSPQRLITGANGNGGTGSGSGGPNAPRALYGQGIFGQQQQQASQSQAAIAVAAAQQLQRNQSGGPVYTVQGRPIVKGTVPEQDQSRGGPMNSSAPQQQQPPKVNVGGPQHKQFMLPNQGNVIRPGDMDPYVAAHFVQQKMILGQQALQRQLNATATPKPAPNIPFYPRGTPMVTPHQNVLRPPVVSNSNENMNFFGRGGIFVPPPALRGQSPNYSQILAYQQQQQKCAQNMKATHQQPQQTDQRTSMDPRTLGNLHPLALQQVFFNVQSQVAQGQGIMQLNNNIGMSGRPDGNFCGGPNMKNQQLMPPGQQGGNRHSPVNLARWFGNDVLKQKMPDMPPVPLQNALSVEELERQQHTTVVHN